jgi:NADH-quinone oxidoreductase subunit F
MEFLKKASLGEPVHLGRRVGVVGGGNSAVDAARVATRLDRGAEVRVLYRRTRAEMPAFPEEIKALIEEGTPLDFLTAPVEILAEDGKIAGLRCVKIELGPPDASGRPRPLPVPGSEFVVPLDSLIVAVGEEPDADFLDQVPESCGAGVPPAQAAGTAAPQERGVELGLALTRGGAVVVSEETLATGRQGVFAGGDVVTGPKTVLDAMGAGKLAAEMIDKHLCGQSLRREHVLTRPSVYVPAVELAEEELEGAERPAAGYLPVAERMQCFAEVELGLPEETAVREACRCLRCDLETRDAQQALERLRGEGGGGRE